MTKMFEVLLRLWPQWLSALIVTLLCISIGLGMGWTSPYLAQLTGEDPLFPITQEQASWIAFLMPFGRLFGAVIGALSVEYFGSKTSLLLTGLPLIVGWICIICANSATWLYVFRILSGVSMGMVFSCYPLYIGEISASSIRGALVSLIINGILLGNLFGNVMGPHISMMCFGIISLTLTLCYMSALPFLPHSPHHLVRRDNMEKAEKAVQWYHRRSDVKGELEAVEYFVKSSLTITVRERLAQLKEPKNRRAFKTIMLLFMFMQLSGLNAISFYMEIIARQAMIVSLAPSSVVIIVNVTGVISGWIALCAIDRYGRRMLLVISCYGATIGMVLLGVHFLLLNHDQDPENLEWLAILSLLTLTALLCFGLVPVPSTMLSELFPTDLKSAAGFVGSVTSAAFAYAAVRSYQPLVDLMSEEFVFWIYAAIIAVCLFYSLTWIPETKGKTLQEIQNMMADSGSVVERAQRENPAGSQSASAN